MNLYQISQDYQNAFLALANMDDIDEQVIEDTLSGFEYELEEKGKNVAAFFQNLQCDVEALKAAEKRIADRRKSIERKAARLKEYLTSNMAECGIKKIECPEFSITLRAPSEVVQIENEELIPTQFKKSNLTISIDKAAIKKAIKFGDGVAGARLTKGKHGLLIK